MPPAHKRLQIRLDPPPAIRALASIDQHLRSLEGTEQGCIRNQPFRAKLHVPARHRVPCQVGNPLILRR